MEQATTSTPPLDQPDRAKLHGLILAFLNELAPEATRKTVSRTIEGDHVPARPITFETLLRTPGKFDGKRVQLVGFYSSGFEHSNFAPKKGADYKKCVWLGEDSTFVELANVERPIETVIIVEGTFNKGPGGHLGLWPGEIARVTRVRKTKP